MIALENILSHEFVQKLGWTLLHFIWQATVVALLVAILLRILRRFSANLRYVTTCLALGLIVLLPVVTIQFVEVGSPPVPVNIDSVSDPVILQTEPAGEMPLTRTIEFRQPVRKEPARTNYFALLKQRAAEVMEPALPHIVTGWLLGVLALSIWHLGGWAQLQQLRKKMVKQVDASLVNKLNILAKKLGVKQAVELLESALVQIPTMVGWLRPVILLPASALTGLNADQLEAILAHELAHIKRYDYLVNILQTFVEILGFYHPAVWWISHKIRAERENCCDDLAVTVTGDRICYARALTSMEEIRGLGELAVAATGGNLLSRIHRLIGKDSSEKNLSCIPAVTVILLLIALAIPTTLALATKSDSHQSGADADVQIEADQDKNAGRRIDNSYFFAQPVTCIVNSVIEQKDCFIDFDNNKLLSPPVDYYSLDPEQQEAWRRENSIDAGGSASEGGEGLWGEQMVVIPVANEGFDRMRPSSFRELLQQATPATPAVMTAIGELPKTYVFKTREGGTGLLQILEILNKQKPNYIKIRYKMVPSTTESDARITSDRKIQDLGKAMVMYEQDHQGILPEGLRDFALYLRNKQDIEWLSQNVEYLGKGKTEKERPDTIIAYDKTLAKGNKGTNVLFLDAHVEFLEAERLKELGISKTSVEIEILPSEEAIDLQTETKQEDSIKKLKQLGLALAMYAAEHDSKLPETLDVLKPYFADEQISFWALNNVTYLGKGRSREESKSSNIPIAYDKSLLKSQQGTNVLFLDAHVGYVDSERLKELGISKTSVQIEMRLLYVGEEFMDELGRIFSLKPDSHTSLDDLQVTSLLQSTQKVKDAKALTAPRATVMDNEMVQYFMGQEVPSISGYTESKNPSEKPEPIINYKQIGTTCELTPHVSPDKRNVLLEFELQISQLIGFEERIFKGQYKERVPQIETKTITTSIATPDDKTLFFDGGTITLYEKKKSTPAEEVIESQERTEEKKRLIILIKPTVLSPEQTEALGLDSAGPQNLDTTMMGGYSGYGTELPPGTSVAAIAV